ncbi:Lysophospholipase L1 [Mucilaginibacter pineti]|uniref:Lysophospholipase L1 n=1 Tax=Mucilaginibacter pineti TaxID=1391627 RepID=A0A1G7B1D3_9SPHI|nr:GDSL-type esterase/lipase family protein [Mucilaginibacter pineti]SDE20899.1 Lysophospholipase L1 [Mucilaginibacter pineti]
MKLVFILPLLLLSAGAFAQQQKADSTANAVAAKTVKEDFRDDWADLHHYAAENKALAPAAASEKRVVFLGSSIFEFWKTRMPEYFNNKAYIDRGISGQISPQLLIRFRQDVIDLKPKAVIILAGSNDLAGTTGHVSIESIMNNVKSMAELAKTNHIKIILCQYLPISEYSWRKELKPADKIIALNKAIKNYGNENGFTVLDYFSPLVDSRNGQRAELTIDGVHPNAAGYKIMAKVTDEAIAKTLK